MKGFLGAAGAALALIIASPFADVSAPSVKLPSITKSASSTTAKTATAPPAASKTVSKKQVADEVKLQEGDSGSA